MVLTYKTFKRMNSYLWATICLHGKSLAISTAMTFYVLKNNYPIFIVFMTIILNLNGPACWSIALFAFLFVSLTNVSEALQRTICDNPFKDSFKVNDNLLLLWIIFMYFEDLADYHWTYYIQVCLSCYQLLSNSAVKVPGLHCKVW